MKNNFDALFKDLTLRMEGFTYLIPVPVAIYFAFTIVSKHLDTTAKSMAFLISCVIAAALSAVSAILWRFFRLKKLASDFKSGKTAADKTKLILMTQPSLESVVIVFRWLIGIIQGYGCGYYFAGIPLSAAIESGIVVFALIAPIDSARVYLISESTVAAFLEKPPFQKVIIPESKIRFHPYWKKIVWTLLSIVWLPYVMLGYLMYAERSGMVSIANPLTHILVMGSLMILPIIIMSVHLGRGISQGLRTAYGQLMRVSDGDFDVSATAISRDEFGAQAYAINEVIMRLRRMYQDIKDLNSTLEHKVEARTQELSEALEKMRTAQAQLIQAGKMSALGEMAGGIAHEINNPLAIIQMGVSQIQETLMEENFKPPQVAETLMVVQDTVERIGKIIRSLRDFSRDGGEDPKRPENLADLIQSTLNLCAEKFTAEGIRISVDCGNPSTQIICRRIEISQVMLNLLNNARDAMQDSQNKWIKLQCRTDSRGVEIRVHDAGPGIAPHMQEKIFQPFFTTKDVGKGTGLGLSISKSFVEANDGFLTLDSEISNSCFLMRFPLAA